MNLKNFYKLNKIMKERVDYFENGDSENGDVYFRIIDELDRQILELLNKKG